MARYSTTECQPGHSEGGSLSYFCGGHLPLVNLGFRPLALSQLWDPSFSRGSYRAIKLPWAYIPCVFMHQMALGKEGDSQVELVQDFECESPRRIMGGYCPPRGHPHLPWDWDKPLLWVLTLGQASSPCWPTRMYSVSSFSRLKMPRTDTP